MKLWLKVLLAAFVLGIIAIIYVYFFLWNKPHTDFDKAKPDFSIQAEVLYNEYKTDAKAAGLKYNGKVLEISGNLSSIENKDTLIIAVFAFEQGMFGDQGVRCSFLPKYFEAGRMLQSGAAVKLKGVCQGFTDDVILESASIVE